MSQWQAQFWFFREGAGNSFSIVYHFSRKMFLILYSINWPNLIVWLPLFLEISGNICIEIVCFRNCDEINSEINLIILIRRFLYVTKNSTQIFKYLENKKSYQGQIKAFPIIYKGFSVAKNCLRSKSIFKYALNSNGPCSDLWGTPWIKSFPKLKCLRLFKLLKIIKSACLISLCEFY